MVQKRPFGDEEVYEVSIKHPRQLNYCQLVSSLDFAPSDFVGLKPHSSDEDVKSASKCSGDERLANGIISELPTSPEKESGSSAPECISNSSWGTSSTSEEDGGIEIPFRLPFFSEYCSPARPTRIIQFVDSYSSLLEHPPRKSIPVGPDFQAVVPEWRPLDRENMSSFSDRSEISTCLPQAIESDCLDSTYGSSNLAGVCIVPISDIESSSNDGDEAGVGRTDCCCRDIGSIRCVRQHIVEAREKLRGTLGQHRLEELGFSDMGELVAEKWSEEEEQLFQEVVFSYPASLGKNFWVHLSMVFPSRTKKEIVSYYFNVFMLRKRAEQNRFDPLNIDSDNDEWQGSEDSGDDEIDTIEEGNDIESPEYHEVPSTNEFQEDDAHVFDRSASIARWDNHEIVVSSSDRDINCASETRCTQVLHNSTSDRALALSGQMVSGEVGDHEVRGETCTSSDVRSELRVAKLGTNDGKAWLGTNNSVNGGHEYVLEPCDTKVWEDGYLSIPETGEDFLPTCSVIEEVFGVGSWNYKASGDNGLS